MFNNLIFNIAYCKNPVDGTWWSFDDTRVIKLSSPADVKTASAYILFYHRRGYPTSQQPNPHWCRNLLKKHKLAVAKGESNGIEINKSSNGEAENGVQEKMVNGHGHPAESPTTDGSGSDSDKDNTASYQNGEASSPGTSEESSVMTSTESNFTAPLARMEEVSMGLSPYIKEVQIESTV